MAPDGTTELRYRGRMRRFWGLVFLVLLLATFSAGVGCKVNLGDETKAEEADEDDDGSTKKKKKTKKKDDDEDSSSSSGQGGKFVFKFAPAKTDTFKPYEALFRHGRLKSLVDVMGMIGFPRDVPVATVECGEPNAYYNSQKHAVLVCYELAHFFYQKFLSQGLADEAASNSTLNALTFVLLHEMGHAVIGELDLGVMGGEEDAVDDLAALVLIDAKQPQWAADGAIAFKLLAEGGKPVFHDEHSFGEQRFFNILCVVFGSDPDKYTNLVEQGVLPKARAVRCPTEYKRKDKAWTEKLAPHIRKR